MKDNLELPAYPLPLVGNHEGEVKDASDWEGSNIGFTKLELASLMMASGMIQGAWTDGFPTGQMDNIKVESVKLAKAVLAEANK